MSLPRSEQIRDAISVIAPKIKRYSNRRIGEQNTKTSMIEPMLEALGWDIRDPEEVCQEFKPTSRDNPVDYALQLMREPRLFVEAKGLGEDITDRRWVAQVLSYATVAGVQWCVLTDGVEYRFYNSTAAVDAERKLFCRVSLVEDAPDDVARVLDLISRENMEENCLDRLWKSHFIDRRVRHALSSLLDPVSDRLVRLIRTAEPELRPKEISESIRRLDISIEAPSPLPDRPVAPAETSEKKAVTKRKSVGSSDRADFNVTLAQLIDAGVLPARTKLFKKYKGIDLQAMLQVDGEVEFEGRVYSTCSTAGEAARQSVTGRKMNTNGWTFWKYMGEDGKERSLAEARTEFLKSQ